MFGDEYLWMGYDAQEGTTGSTLGSLEVSTVPAAVEYVDGYVFTVTGVFDDFKLQVSRDDDLEVFYEAELDPSGAHMLMGLSDLAYNPANGTLYAIVSAVDNFWGNPYLASIDMELGTLKTNAEVGEGLDSLACDSDGRFYGFAGYGSELYTFTLDTVTSPELVGSTEAFAWTCGNGSVTLAYAAGSRLDQGESAATVTFLPVGTESAADVTVRYGECNETVLDTVHNITAELGKTCPSAAFEDLATGTWYYEAVDFVLEEGMMRGMSANILDPAEP